jgi:hypothetical protein
MSPSIPDLAANLRRLDGSRFAHVTLKDQKYAEYTENMDYSVGSRVLVKLYSGDIVIAEIVVIFTASVRKKILVEFARKFERVDPDQIIEVLSSV